MLTTEDIANSLKAFDISGITNSELFACTTKGRHAESITVVVTLDKDARGATILATLPEPIPREKRALMYDLLNQVHGQELWNFRMHLDDEGHLVTSGRLSLWEQPFNEKQLHEVFLTILVTTDRIAPCLRAIREGKSADEAFQAFFLKPNKTQQTPRTDA